MKKILLVMVLLVLALPAAPAEAGVHARWGFRLDGLITAEPELWGEGLLDAEWAEAIEGEPLGDDASREQFFFVNRPSFVLGPALFQEIYFDFGFGVEIAEGFRYLTFAPNRGVDVRFDRLVIPLTITPRYRFTLGSRDEFRPYLGAGAGFHYTITNISGSDLFAQRENPDYAAGEANPDEPRHLRQGREFGRSDWFFGFHGTAGLDWHLTDQLAVNAAFQYEYVAMESVEIGIAPGEPGEIRWEEETVEGNGGGYLVQIGVAYGF